MVIRGNGPGLNAGRPARHAISSGRIVHLLPVGVIAVGRDVYSITELMSAVWGVWIDGVLFRGISITACDYHCEWRIWIDRIKVTP
jgi:hypothetical protein